jgi:hypothetical protein
MREFFAGMNGKQSGDPAKLAKVLLAITDLAQPPFRFIAGADAIAQAETTLADLQRDDDVRAARERRLANSSSPCPAPLHRRLHHKSPVDYRAARR